MLRIKQGELIISLNQIEFNEEEKIFKLSSNNNEFIELEIGYSLKAKKNYESRIKEFTMYSFYNKDCSENSIFQVYDKEYDKRIGWIFPIQALISNEHDYSDNVHFLRYAYIAFKKLLEVQENIKAKEIEYEDRTYSVLDFYNEDMIILILDSENINEIKDFEFNDYILDLYKYGYCVEGSNKLGYFEEVKKNIKLHKIKQFLREEDYIFELFKNFLGKETSPLLKFYLLYQVIELIIEKIFNKELSEMLEALGNNTTSLFDIKESLNNIAKEKDRIIKISSKYSERVRCAEELKANCNRLLTNQGKEEENEVGQSLYKVRNLLVHNYRGINEQNKYIIEEVTISFEKYIIELLTKGLVEI